MKVVSVKMPIDLIERLDACAKRAEKYRSEIIRDAIEEYLARHNNETAVTPNH